MIFGPVPVGDALGAILAHSHRLPGRVLKKGRVLDEADLAALAEAGVAEVTAARLEPGDVPEDEAATRIADAALGEGVRATRAATGRVNLHATLPGLLSYDRAALDRLNGIDESVTLAALPPDTPVTAGEMVATIKVIPFAVADSVLLTAEPIAEAARCVVRPFTGQVVALVSTLLPGLKPSVVAGTERVTRARVEALGGALLPPVSVPHETGAVAQAIRDSLAQGAGLVLIAGASAVVDRRDVAPAGIVAAGGAIEHFGMPVDPGNLLLLGRVGQARVIVLPGCARSPKANGFDLVLRRLMAGLPVGPRDIMGWGAGGLLLEIELRPLPRADAPARATEPRRGAAALVLAAGRSSRAAPRNKLLVQGPDGRALVARTVDQVLASALAPVLVVTGHEAERVEAALAGRDIQRVHNPEFAQGMAGSIRAGIEALPEGIAGVLVALGDMPLVSPALLDRMAASLPGPDGIVVPTWQGTRGNPVLWGAGHRDALAGLSGDAGARGLLARHEAQIVEVEAEDDGCLRDFDTAEALEALASG